MARLSKRVERLEQDRVIESEPGSCLGMDVLSGKVKVRVMLTCRPLWELPEAERKRLEDEREASGRRGLSCPGAPWCAECAECDYRGEHPRLTDSEK